MAEDLTPRLRPYEVLLRGGKAYQLVHGNTGPHLIDVSAELVGVSGLVKRFKLAGPMIVTRWVKAGLPHMLVAGRRVFRLPVVEDWLQDKGYSLGKLRAGAGLVSAHKRRGRRRWRKGQMSPAPDAQGSPTANDGTVAKRRKRR